MTPTVFGYLFAVAAIACMPASITTMLSLVLFASLMGAASAISLNGLGGATITPASLALLFLVLRILLSPAGQFSVVAKAVQQNMFFSFFCLYGAATAFLFPYVFFHALNVPPLRMLGGGLFATAPVEFSSQNITTAVYLIGTFLASLSACIAYALERRENKLLNIVAIVSWIHIGFGVLDIVLGKIGLRDALAFFRNANYQQLAQDIGGIQRVAGIFPEASAYAAFAFSFLILNTELWMRNVRPILTGTTAFALLIMSLLTTSSTAYVSLAIYALLLLVRMFLTPMRLPLQKRLILGTIALIAITALLVLEVFMPAMSNFLIEILNQLTLQKLHTVSGMQRTFWAQKGWEAFWKSGWIGIGAGSFRSSGLLSAVAGSLGAIGLAALAGSVWMILRPTRTQTYDVQITGNPALRSAFAWAATFTLVPALFSLPSPDPGIIFGIFAGIAVSDLPTASRARAVPLASLGRVLDIGDPTFEPSALGHPPVKR
jgi:hypothetical protein